jgi:hypothetical protein
MMPHLMKAKYLLLVIALAAGMAAHASGAPWYRWMNRVDRTILCSKISPGDAWEKYQGPFQDSRCRKEGNPQ